jgi:DNA-binding NarL/FixJ family response regulator
MARGIPIAPPPGLVARKLVMAGEELVIFSYPAGDNGGDPQPAPEPLTPAESAVARLLLTGQSNAEIAAARRVTPSTIAKQIEKIFRRFGVHSRAEFAAHPRAALYG